ncbi:MAG TPA: LiaF domain-containing protein, partial [Solirubrobacteraceae bacterium]|nr:LiaF domain-containing protein [Solirubrobacteraceae bacterium]
SVSDIRPSYELGMGQLVVDMRDVDLPAGTTKLDLQLGIGHAVVRVPEDACVSSNVQVGAGHAQVLDRVSDGLDVDFAEAAAPAGDQPRLQIDGDLGIGALEVVRGDDPIPSNRDGWWDDRANLGTACP